MTVTPTQQQAFRLITMQIFLAITLVLIFKLVN